jgi:tetratricopeptide (TPR) repeat protein
VKAALEGRDIPPAGSEGILWILTALQLPPSEAMKTLESATGPDQGILMQAQAQLLAAEGKFTEALGRAAAAPLPMLKTAVAVSNSKPAMVLEAVGDGASPFARALKAAALLQTGTAEAMEKLNQVEEVASLPFLRFERGIRRLAGGNHAGALEDLKASSTAGGAYSAAWLGFAHWHARDFDAAIQQLATATQLKPSPELAAAIDETAGYALQAKGEEEAGSERLVSAAGRTPTREVFFKIATHLRGNRQWKALQELAQPIARSFPSDPEPWAAKAEAAFWLKDYDAAISTVTFAMGQKIDPRRYLKWRALAYEEQKKWAEAHEDWDRLTTAVSQEGDAFAHRAWMKANLGRWSGVKDDAEQGISRGGDAWSSALARFALAAEALHGPAPEGETIDAASRKDSALEHLRLAVKTGAVEPSDLKPDGPFAPLASSEEWKKIVESASEKQAELKNDAKRGAFLGVMLDHGGGSVAVTGTYRKSGARQAGLAPGDVILEVEGRRVSHIGDVGSLLAGRDAGTSVKIKLERELRPKVKMVEVRDVTLTPRNVFED